MTAATAQLPIEIRSYLERFAARRRWQRLVRAGGAAALVTLAWMAAWCGVDRLIGLHWIVRSAALAANVACVLAMLTGPVLALFRRVDAPRVAVEVERRQPRFAQRLATVTSRALGPESWRGSTQLLAALSAEVADEVRQDDPGKLLPWRPALRPWLAAGVAAAALFGLSRWSWLDLPTLTRRYLAPLADVRPVTSTRLAVRPGDVELPEGNTLVVHVEPVRLGEVPPTLHVRSPGQPWHDQPMSAAPAGAFEARVRDVGGDLEYFVSGGDARSDTFAVAILRKPAIESFHIRYAYPPYTRLSPREVENTTGQVEAPVGTEVTLTIESTEPLKLAVMTIGGAALRMTPVEGRPNAHEATFIVRADQRYTIRMASAREVSGAFRGGTIRAIADRSPLVQLRRPAGGAAAGAVAGGGAAGGGAADGAGPLTVAYHAVDDYGLARLDAEMTLTRRWGETARSSVSIPVASNARDAHGRFTPDLAALAARAGDRLALRLRAEDRGGQFDLSAAIEFIVPPVAATAPAPPPPPPLSSPASSTSSQPSGSLPPLDPQDFDEALEAYFDALRGAPAPKP